MNQNSDEQIQNALARIVSLEELFTHLQQTTQELSDEILLQRRRLDKLTHESTRLTAQLEEVVAHLEEDRKPEDEKPPHY